jgi:hypothetical protein
MKIQRYHWLMSVFLVVLAVLCGIAVVTISIKKNYANKELTQEAEAAKKKAQNGDVDSEVALSKMYYYGRGLPQSYSDAFYWSRKAGDSGNVQAKYDLGLLYQRGQGAPQDLLKASQCFRDAATQGHSWAQVNLGKLYYYGHGVGQDYTAATMWYRKAAESGLPRAEYLLGYMYEHGQGVQQDSAAAKIWYEKASSQGDESAERALGLRGSGLHGNEVVLLVAIGLAWIWTASQTFSSRRPSRRLLLVLIVVSGLTYVVMRTAGAYSGFRSARTFEVFQFIEHLAAGIAIGMLVYFSSAAAKFARRIWGTTVTGLVVVAFYVLQHKPSLLNLHDQIGVLMLSGLLLGVTITVGAFCISRARP